MANELTITAKIEYSNGGIVDSIDVTELAASVSANAILHRTQTIGSSEEALGLGDLATPGFLVGVNRSAVGQLHIRAGTGATDLVELGPGEPCLMRLSTAATAPYAISVGGDVLFEYMLIES